MYKLHGLKSQEIVDSREEAMVDPRLVIIIGRVDPKFYETGKGTSMSLKMLGIRRFYYSRIGN